MENPTKFQSVTLDEDTTDFDDDSLKALIRENVKNARIPKKLKLNIVTDTSNFFKVDYNDIAVLGGRPYLIRNCEKEGRFGIDDEPKFWVKRAIDLIDGKMKIIKMVFHERFQSQIGNITFECVRSPRKEARILHLVRDNPNFMQGFAVEDTKGNLVRIIDFIRGKNLGDYVALLGKDHEDYYFNHFSEIFSVFIELVKAICFLHANGEKHGDIRRDHIIKDVDSDYFRWIDFDYNYSHRENIFGYDLFGLGNVLIYLAGRGDVIIHDVKRENPDIFHSLSPDDFNVVFKNRISNLKKIFPYLSTSLNNILIRFSKGSRLYYSNASNLLQDLEEIKDKL